MKLKQQQYNVLLEQTSHELIIGLRTLLFGQLFASSLCRIRLALPKKIRILRKNLKYYNVYLVDEIDDKKCGTKKK